MPKLTEDDEKAENLNNFNDFVPGKLPPEITTPPTASGVPHFTLAPSIPMPPAVPEHFVCLRGPCKHYLEIQSPSDVENRTLGYLPVQISRYCRAIQGAILALDDDSVFSCTEWDPRVGDYSLEQRRLEYLKKFPGCATADAERKKQRDEALAQRDIEYAAHALEQEVLAASEKVETPNVKEWLNG